MQPRDYKKGLFVRCIGDQIISYRNKTQRPCSEIWPPVTLVGERDKSVNGFPYLFTETSGRQRPIVRDGFPYFCDVQGRAGMEIEALLEFHLEERRFTSSFSRESKLSKKG